MSDEIQRALEPLFAKDSALYQARSFARRIGFGERPALLNIDLANAGTRPGHAFSCEGMETVIPAVQTLLDAFRAKGLPVVYTTTAYDITEGPNSDMGLWQHKIPAEMLAAGSEAVAIAGGVAQPRCRWLRAADFASRSACPHIRSSSDGSSSFCRQSMHATSCSERPASTPRCSASVAHTHTRAHAAGSPASRNSSATRVASRDRT